MTGPNTSIKRYTQNILDNDFYVRLSPLKWLRVTLISSSKITFSSMQFNLEIIFRFVAL